MANKDKLLDRDIKERFEYEKQFVKDPDDHKTPGKALQIIIAITLAVIVLGGILYPLITQLLG
ncbi:hypothetical protein [Schleiferilactobacillus perolens]|uniref:Uncharacterized protein n=1 Tax=Schleiferilactobacillus perolens DSM 12744 TaxID=1423792 RepID=A0A0R1N4A8_9LACO|nr:hypothetical protein [Schleiferilactobacillus perolens]KRL12613.1 hypothetical protein FD09_GL002933 [Schleiferilactobacillus perolens DSM 12744]